IVLSFYFKDSFSLDRLKIPITTISVDESSCVVVRCLFKPQNKIQYQQRSQRIIWFKDAIYNNEKKDFEGTIVFSNIISPVDPEFARRVEYLGDLNFITKAETFTPCDVKLSHLRKEDTGNYSFRYYGSNERWMSDKVLLIVKENPCSISLEGNPASHEGENISLTCRTKGSCNKDLQWQYPPDGIQIPTEPWTEVEQGSKVGHLTFTPTWKSHQKTLSCQIQGSKDECAARSITLNITYPPKETTATINPVSVNEGNKVTLSCSSKGNPEILTYTWFKEGTGIIGSVNEYTFKKIQIADRGRYFCQAKNALGIANSSVIVIDVKYAPKNVTIVMNPSNDMIEGTSVNLTCTIESSNPFKCEFEWYRGTVLISTGKTLFFRSIEYTNAGFYSCVVSNSVGTGKSNTTHVNVLPHSEYHTYFIRFSVISVVSKIPVFLPCLESGKYSSFLTLLAKRDPISKRSSAGGKTSNSVVLKDQGWEFLPNASETDPPITPNLTLQSDVIEGYQTTIYCSVQSHPPSVLSLVPSKHRVTTSSNSITVAFRVSFEDTGKYVCIAQNSEGKSKAEEYLKVKYAPKSTSLVVYPSTEIRENQEGRISCKTQAHPPVTEYSWFKITDHKEHRVGKGAELNFKEISFMDSGKYFCRVKNDIGENKSAITELKVWYAPKNTTVVYNLSGQKTPKGMVWLMCSSKGYPPVNRYRWYKVNDRKVETFVSHDQNITVTSAERVSYYCIAYNDVSNQQSSLQALPIYCE
ncbi:CD22 protein, partial [Atractosteus spatula]|nr:CD22 protein [Atractosteus spatula]